jgi:hypothetical protein
LNDITFRLCERKSLNAGICRFIASGRHHPSC